jgi:hypothetical protein
VDPVEPTTPDPQRACEQCGAALAPGQGWCLECGRARPARRGVASGWRAAATVGGLVAALALGAVAAAYAALTDSPTAPTTIAAAAPVVATAASAAPPATTATTPAAPTTTSVRSIPAPPAITAPTSVPAPAQLPPADTDTTTTTTTTETTTPTTTTTTPTETTTTTASPSETPGLQEVALGPGAASVYDPYHSASDQTDPADAYDDKADTVFTLTALLGAGQAPAGQTTTTPADTTATVPAVTTTTVTTGTVVQTVTTTTTAAEGEEMGVGLDFSFDRPTEVSALRVHTTTPGFTVEVYGTDQGLPDDLLDAAWKHLGTEKRFGARTGEHGARIVTIPRGRYRHLLLWFTTPPTAAVDATGSGPTAPPTVGISDVKVLD